MVSPLPDEEVVMTTVVVHLDNGLSESHCFHFPPPPQLTLLVKSGRRMAEQTHLLNLNSVSSTPSQASEHTNKHHHRVMKE